MDNPCLLETRNLKKYFPAGQGRILHALDGVNLRIQPGRTLGVVGESGCGKSTLGKTILRLTEPTDGQIFLNGQDITAMSKGELRKLRRKMQLIFQDPYASLNPRMTVEDSIAEPMVVNKMFKTRAEVYGRVDELMEIVGLAPRNAALFPHEISGGLRQRVGIARALATDPEFIVCDEPVSALDVSIQAQILNLLMDLQDQLHISYLFISHDLSVVKHISHDVAVMYLGQCVEMGSTEEIFRHPLHPYTRTLLDAIPTPTLASRDKEPRIIRGEVVSPIDPAPGCRFAVRCPHATEVCRQPQQERELRPGHTVLCCRAEELNRP